MLAQVSPKLAPNGPQVGPSWPPAGLGTTSWADLGVKLALERRQVALGTTSWGKTTFLSRCEREAPRRNFCIDTRGTYFGAALVQGRAHGCSAGVTKRPNDLGCSAGAGTRTWLQRRIAKRLPRSIAGRQSRPKRMPKTRPMAPQATKIAARNRSWWSWGVQGRSGDASGLDRDAPKRPRAPSWAP